MNRITIPTTMLIIVTALFLSCSQGIDIEAQNKAIVLEAFDAMNNHDYDRVKELLAPDYLRHSQATPDAVIDNRDDFMALIDEWMTAFPDAKQTVHLLAADSNLVAFYVTFSGTHEGPMGPFPATGKRMDSETAGFHRLENGKIVETWVTWDNMAVMQQLGLLPPPPNEGS